MLLRILLRTVHHHLFDVSLATEIQAVHLSDGPADEDRCQHRSLKFRLKPVVVELKREARSRTTTYKHSPVPQQGKPENS